MGINPANCAQAELVPNTTRVKMVINVFMPAGIKTLERPKNSMTR
jgi:hypothetical protein